MRLDFRRVDICRDVLYLHWMEWKMWEWVSQIIYFLYFFITDDWLYWCINVVNQKLLDNLISNFDGIVRKLDHVLRLLSILSCRNKAIWSDCIQFRYRYWFLLFLIFFILLSFLCTLHCDLSSWWFWWKYRFDFRFLIQFIIKLLLSFIFVVYRFSINSLLSFFEINLNSLAIKFDIIWHFIVILIRVVISNHILLHFLRDSQNINFGTRTWHSYLLSKSIVLCKEEMIRINSPLF